MSSLKNIIIIIVCIACGTFAYFLTRSDGTTADMGTNSAVRQELIAKTQSFIERSNKLQTITIDQAFFMDATFTSLRSFSTPVPNQALGRNDLFGTQTTIDAVGSQTDLAE
jgi:hypothetical protein